MIRAVLFDLDGVIRHFPSTPALEIERRFGLSRGSLDAAAFAEPLITEVTTGRISRAEWVSLVGAAVGSPAAAVEWGTQRGEVDAGALDLLTGLRAAGLVTAILTNGTDTVPQELDELSVTGRVDAIFNSASIGYRKPDPRAFRHVLDSLDMDGSEVFFTDDSRNNVSGAAALGLTVHLFDGLVGLRTALRRDGVSVAG